MSNKKCLMKNLRFDIEISIYGGLFQAAGYEDDEEGYTKLIHDLLTGRFESYCYDNTLMQSPPLEVNWVQKKQQSPDCEVWEEV